MAVNLTEATRTLMSAKAQDGGAPSPLEHFGGDDNLLPIKDRFDVTLKYVPPALILDDIGANPADETVGSSGGSGGTYGHQFLRARSADFGNLKSNADQGFFGRLRYRHPLSDTIALGGYFELGYMTAHAPMQAMETNGDIWSFGLGAVFSVTPAEWFEASATLGMDTLWYKGNFYHGELGQDSDRTSTSIRFGLEANFKLVDGFRLGAFLEGGLSTSSSTPDNAVESLIDGMNYFRFGPQLIFTPGEWFEK